MAGRMLAVGVAAGVLVLALALGAVSPGQAFPNGYDYARVWHPMLGVGQEVPVVGDFDGDNRDDVAIFVRDTKPDPERGAVGVALCEGRSFGPMSKWADRLCLGQEVPAAGDFNGDGRDDVIVFVKNAATGRETGDVYVALSTGSSFGPAERKAAVFAQGAVLPMVGDFNGDGKADIICFSKSYFRGEAEGDVYVQLSDGNTFLPPTKWHDWFAIQAEVPLVGDFDGDHKDDIATVLMDGPEAGKVYVARSLGDHCAESAIWATNVPWRPGAPLPRVGDPNRDGKDDLVLFLRGTPNRALGAADPAGDVLTMLSNGTGFGRPVVRNSYFCVGDEYRLTGDFNGSHSQALAHRRAHDDIITFVRDTQGGTGRGDAYVAISTFGMPSTWRLRARQLRAVQLNESADEPYVTCVGFRSRPGTEGSTQVFWSGNLGEIAQDVHVGTVCNIPPAMGELTFTLGPLPTRADLATGARPECLGAVVTALEHDDTGWDTIRDRANNYYLPRARGLIAAATEGHPWTAIDGVRLWNSSYSMVITPEDELLVDDDDLIGWINLCFVAVDGDCEGMQPGWGYDAAHAAARPIPLLGEWRLGFTDAEAQLGNPNRGNGVYRLAADLLPELPAEP